MSTESINSQGTQALERCFGLLRELAEAPATARQLSAATGLARSTAIRMLSAMESERFVVLDSSLRYWLGPRIPELYAAWTSQRPSFAATAEPYLQRLAARYDETSCFVVRDGNGGVCLAQVESVRSTKFMLGVGRSYSGLHAGALHKAMLAFSDASVIGDVMRSPLERFGPATITDATALQAELDTIRLDGVAESRGERDCGEVAMAAPVFGQGEFAVGAIGVGLPEQRFAESLAPALRSDVRDAAAAMSVELGSSRTAPIGTLL